jgi:hypothetical protein
MSDHQPHLTETGWQDPALLQTTKGLWPVEALERIVGGHDTADELCTFVEYRLDGELVHRSVDLKLKKAIFAGAFQATL